MSAERAPSARAALEGEYEILRELGIGGTAIVYLARKRSTGAEVAIKLIRATYLEDEEALARFAREARYASRLEHPNVVPIREVLPLGGGGVALVMAHIRGRTLKQLVRDEGKLSPDRAQRILRDVAAGLSAAHAMDIIHRDVKPENIFIEENGDALLADFGLARSTARDSGDTQLTMTGVAIGTPTYMPPEQIDGGTIDARGDVYSLGLVAWEMLTGKRPWDGDSLYALLYHQKHDYLPDIRELRDDVPDGFAGVIATATEKNPDARWQSIDEMIAALDGVIPARRPSIRPAASETMRVPRVGLPSADALVDSPALAAGSNLPALDSPAPEREPSPPRFPRFVPGVTFAAAVVAAIAIVLAIRQPRLSLPRAGQSQPAASVQFQSAASVVTSSVGAAPASATADAARRDTTATLTADSAHVGDVGPTKVLSPSTIAAPHPTLAGEARSVPATEPPPVVAAERVTIAAGGMHTCLISADGRGYCWGANTSGQLGTTSNGRVALPSPIGRDLQLTSIAAGLSHTCAIARGGAAWCWGENDRGQLGDRSEVSRLSPVRVADGHVFRTITTGADHSCALDSDGNAWCWGAGTHGQLGTGADHDSSAPIAVTKGRFTALATGWDFTCALDVAGRAYCWGANDAGQLGVRDTIDRLRPAPVSSELAFTSIAAGADHACGLTAQGTAYCWGKNSSGQLGDGTTSSRSAPAPVRTAGDVRFTSIAAGAKHTCAIDTEGRAQCWGLGSYGQLGDGANVSRSQPVSVAGSHRFSSVQAFGSHTCGATLSGDVFCWGYNLEGQLGDGTRANRSRPVYVEPPAGG